MIKKILSGVILCVICYLPTPASYGQEIGHGVMWDANTESNLAGYKLHYGQASGDYTVHIDAGNVLEYVFFTNPAITNGSYYFAATAYDTDGEESGYSNELYIAVDITAEVTPLDGILDNDSQWTKAIGTWQVSTSMGFYGTNSKYSNIAGDKYIFESSNINGQREVFLWWTYFNTRCSNVPVQVYDGSNLIDTRIIDQTDQAKAGQWNVLGLYSFSDTARVLINSPGGCTASADAVRISNVPISPPQKFRISGTITLTPISKHIFLVPE